MKRKLLSVMLMGIHGLFVSALVYAAPLPSLQNPEPQTGAVALGQAGTPSHSVPILRIVSPTQGATTVGNVKVILEMALHESDARVEARLNGKDVSREFKGAGCKGQICTSTATLSAQDGLENGTNLLAVRVGSPHTARGAAKRVTFSYQALLGDDAPKVNRYTPASVGINTTNNPANLAPGPWVNIVTGYQNGADDPIATLPSPLGSGDGSRTIAYANASYGPSNDCLYGFNPYLAVVLDRRNPTSKEYSWCGNSAADLDSSAKAALGRDLGPDDLVVFGSTALAVQDGLDTSMFGGTNFGSIWSADAYPYHYVMIGVKGAAPGTAHEAYSVETATSAPQTPPTLNGTLVLDGTKHYNYVPSGEMDFLVNAAGVAINGNYNPYTPPDPSAGFWLLVLDRTTLQPVNYPFGTTTSTCLPTDTWGACGSSFDVKGDGGKALAAALNSIDSRKLIFLSTTSCPFDSADQIDASLGDALQNLGGVRYSLNALTTTAGTCNYSLVTVNDGAHQSFTSKVALSANQFSAQGQSGTIHGYLAINKSGFYDIAAKDQGIVNDGATSTIDYTYEHIVSQPRQNWPLTDTAAGLMTYYDISYQLLTDPDVNEKGSYLYDIRYFYTNIAIGTKLAALVGSRLDSKATNPVVPSSWDTAPAATFAQARATIMAELQQFSHTSGYLTGSDGAGGISGLLAGTNTHILADALKVASDIGTDQDDAKQQMVNGNMSDMLNLLAGIASTAAPVIGAADPQGGVFMGVLSGMLWTGSAAGTPLGIDTTTTILGPGSSYDVLLSQLSNNADDYATNLQEGFNGTVDTILSDPGKLAQVGALTADTDGAWGFSNLVSADVLSASIKAGARMSLWLDVLPNLYGVRTAAGKDSNDPATFGSWVYEGQYKSCQAVYTKGNSGGVPALTMTQNHHIGDGQSASWDVSLIAEGKTVNYPENPLNVQDPSMSENLATLLTTSQTVVMPSGSETGLNIPRQLLLNSGPLVTSPMAYFAGSPEFYCDAGGN